MTETELTAATRRLDEVIAAMTRPLLDRHDTGDESAADTLRRIGVSYSTPGCAIANMAGLDLAGLDVAVVAAQDRVDAMSAAQAAGSGAAARSEVRLPGESWGKLING